MNGLNFEDPATASLYLNLWQESACILAESDRRVGSQIDRREVAEADRHHRSYSPGYDAISSSGQRYFWMTGYCLQEMLQRAAVQDVSTHPEGLGWELRSVLPAVQADFDPDQYGFSQCSEDQG